MKPSIIALLAMLGLVGCTSSKPMTYLVLSPVSGPVLSGGHQIIAVGRVALPPTIDRSFLTTGTGENTVAISYDSQWAAPLEPMAQSVLARDLASRLPSHTVLMPGDNIPDKAIIVSVNTTTFLPYSGRVVLEADWRVRDTAHNITKTGRSLITTPTKASAQAQARSMSTALGLLADQIAQQVED